MPKRHIRGTKAEEFDFNKEQKLMKMFSDNAGLYIKLSSSAIALMVAIPKTLFGITTGSLLASPTDKWAFAAIAGCFLFAAAAGAFYQYLAVKYMEFGHDAESYKGAAFCEPGTMYGVMLACFYLGAVLFIGYAAKMIDN